MQPIATTSPLSRASEALEPEVHHAATHLFGPAAGPPTVMFVVTSRMVYSVVSVFSLLVAMIASLYGIRERRLAEIQDEQVLSANVSVAALSEPLEAQVPTPTPVVEAPAASAPVHDCSKVYLYNDSCSSDVPLGIPHWECPGVDWRSRTFRDENGRTFFNLCDTANERGCFWREF